MKILSVVGARPNFMKIAPFIHAINSYNDRFANPHINNILVHTGQHFDSNMSDEFFKNLEIPLPDYNLEIGSGTHAYQVGTTMIEFEQVLLKEQPDWVVVVGDVNATCACSLTAKKYEVSVAHIEAGLRSNDWSMPEEINRVVTDKLSDLLFTTCHFADENLKSEAIYGDRVRRVGNIMIDTMEEMRELAEVRPISTVIKNNLHEGDQSKFDLTENEFVILTMHRPSNVDDEEILAGLVKTITQISEQLTIIFPVHPRTMERLKHFGHWNSILNNKNIILLHPIGYIDLLSLNMKARMILTDSGGIQEECCILGTPCITLRWNTERPITLVENGGTNLVVGNEPEKIDQAFVQALGMPRKPFRPDMWDGHTAKRILDALISY